MLTNLLSDDGHSGPDPLGVAESVHKFQPEYDSPNVENVEHLKIYYSNLDTFSNKKEEIVNMVNDEDPDIIVFNEILSKSNPTITKAELNIKGYDHFYKEEKPEDKTDKRRGVIIYTKESLNAQYFDGFDNVEFRENIWITFKSCNNEKVLVGNVYHSGSSSDANTEKLLEILKSPCYNLYDHVYICGDFNYPTIDWEGGWSNERDNKLVEASRKGFLTQHISKPTRYKSLQTPNILDLVFTRYEHDVNTVYYCSPLGKSDHVLLKILTSIPKKKFKVKCSLRYDWKNGNYGEFRKYILNIDWSVLHGLDVEECWEYIKSKLDEGIKLFIPLVKCSGELKDKPPWFSFTIKKSVKKKYKLFKRWLESDSSFDYQEYVKFRNEVSRLIRAAKKSHERKVAYECKLNPKAFWKYVNSFRKCKENISTLQREDGSLTTDDGDKANILINFFSSVLTIEDMHNLPNIPPGKNSNGKFVSDLSVTEEQVKDKLKNLNPNKSPGPDKLYPRALKELCEELAAPLAVLFNKSLDKGVLPSEWKLAEITAIFKKGNKTSPNNYRPVSLTCILCKVLESFVRDVVQNHMETLKLYSKCQHGFRKGKSCITQLLNVMNDFSNYINDRKTFDVIYLDFAKAFDSVPHERLLVKLKSYGIDGKLFLWIRDFLSYRKQYVKVGDKKSETRDVTSGVPQGSILGPILFLIFINDLPECVESICTIFADDTKSYNESKHFDIMQRDVNALQEWSELWQLFFNSIKCKCMYYGRNNPKHEYHFYKGTEAHKIAECSEEKDLGVIFDDTLKFDLHINAAIKKANSMLGLIRRNFKYIDKDIFLKLYKALVRPHLEYGQSIWYPRLIRQSQSLEKVQRRATKLVPSIRDKTYEERLRILGLPSLKYRRIRGDMIQVYKFLSEDKLGYNHLLPLSDSCCGTKGHDLKLYKNRYNCQLRKFSFSFRVVNTWNNLKQVTIKATNTNNFKKLLDDDLINLHYEID